MTITNRNIITKNNTSQAVTADIESDNEDIIKTIITEEKGK